MKCNCKSAGSRNTALAFINDVACVSKKSRRVRKIPLLHLLRRSIAPKCIRMPWNGDERVRSERDKTPLLHFLAISIALTKIGRRIRKTPHLRLLTMSLFHLFLRDLYGPFRQPAAAGCVSAGCAPVGCAPAGCAPAGCVPAG